MSELSGHPSTDHNICMTSNKVAKNKHMKYYGDQNLSIFIILSKNSNGYWFNKT